MAGMITKARAWNLSSSVRTADPTGVKTWLLCTRLRGLTGRLRGLDQGPGRHPQRNRKSLYVKHKLLPVNLRPIGRGGSEGTTLATLRRGCAQTYPQKLLTLGVTP